MSKKPPNKNSEAGYVPIRRGIYEHLSDGRMKGKEWMVYSTLHLKADHQTGICYKVSGPALGHLLGEKTNYINRLMRSLEQKGYIKRITHRGQIKHYPVVINKFLTSNGILIDARNTKSLNEIAWYVEQDCTITAQQRIFNCTANAPQMHCLQEVKNIRIKEVKKNRGKSPRTLKSFTPPTEAQAKEYADSIDYPEFDAKRFIEYHESADWTLADGSPMRSWKRAIVNWKGRDRKRQRPEQPAIPEPAMPTEEQLEVAHKD